jgi:hypothetical protein
MLEQPGTGSHFRFSPCFLEFKFSIQRRLQLLFKSVITVRQISLNSFSDEIPFCFRNTFNQYFIDMPDGFSYTSTGKMRNIENIFPDKGNDYEADATLG